MNAFARTTVLASLLWMSAATPAWAAAPAADHPEILRAAERAVAAMQARDADALTRHFSDNRQAAAREQWGVYFRKRAAREAFLDAVAATFGPAGKAHAAKVRKAGVDPDDHLPTLDHVRRGTVLTGPGGDSAMLKTPGSAHTLFLEKVKDGWGMTGLNKSPGRGMESAEWSQAVEAQVRAYRKLTADVKAGRLKTLRDAAAAMTELERPTATRTPDTPRRKKSGTPAGNVNPADVLMAVPEPEDEAQARSRSPFEKMFWQYAYEREEHGRLNDARTLGLTAKQSAAIDAAWEKYAQGFKEWTDRNGAAIDAADAANADAARRMEEVGGVAGVDLFVAALEPHAAVYRAQLTRLRQHRLAVLSVLTPQQQVRWEGLRVRAHMQELRGDERLSAQQRVLFDSACNRAAAEVAKLPPERENGDIWRIVDEAYGRYLDAQYKPPHRVVGRPRAE